MFPPIPLEWATDDNYDAGADPWSGTPTKVDPTTQTKTKGFIPESGASGQQLNYLLNKFADLGNAITQRMLGQWTYPGTFPTTIVNAGAAYMCWSPWYNKRTRAWYIGTAAGSSGDVFRSRNFYDWAAVTSGLGGGAFGGNGGANNNPASSKYGDMIAANESQSLLRKYDFATATWSSLTFAGGHVPLQIKHDPVNSKWIEIHVVFGGGGAAGCRNAPDTTYTWTDRTLGGTPTTTSLSGRDPWLVISDTGIAVISGMSATTLWVSTDGGTTWTVVTPTIMPKSEHSLVWVPGTQEFLFYGTDGQIYSSPDGVTWSVKVATTPFGGTAGITGAGGYINSMAAIGSVVWCTWGIAAAGPGGVGYSTDGGLTWQFGGPIGIKEGTTTAASRGKLVAGDDSVMACQILGGGTGTVGNGFAFLTGLDRIPLAIFP